MRAARLVGARDGAGPPEATRAPKTKLAEMGRSRKVTSQHRAESNKSLLRTNMIE